MSPVSGRYQNKSKTRAAISSKDISSPIKYQEQDQKKKPQLKDFITLQAKHPQMP
jgi:hypothetical protein